MMIIGCDFHPSWQQVSWLDTETGDAGERKLVQASGDAARFYRQLPTPALIGMEATGNCHWLVDLLAEIGHEPWVGDAAQIAVRFDPGLRKEYLRHCHSKPKAVAKVPAARKLAVRLYWMLRTEKPYPEVVRIESSPRVPLVGAS
jgi:hypothetical protein